jgi:hypothetical protein
MERGRADRLEKGLLNELVFALFDLNCGRSEGAQKILIRNLQRFYLGIWKVDFHRSSIINGQ